MRIAISLLLLAGFWSAQGARERVPSPQALAALPLLGHQDLSYLGSFGAAAEDGSGDVKGDLGWGGWALSVTPESTLLIGGNGQYSRLCELEIPVDLARRANFVAPCVDVTEGRLGQIDDGASTRLGGTLVWNRRLIVSAYSDYDADGSQTFSHFASGRQLTAPNDVVGPVRVGSRGAGFVSGYMGSVPDEWAAALGGPALTGNCCLSIISRTSSGPAVSAFNPDDIGRVAPVPVSELLGYPLSDPLADGQSQNALFNLSTEIKGVAFVQGTRSVLFIGRHGTGTYCYGTGGQSGGRCYDPASEYNGTHAYPYVHQIWAYDALDLADVKAGRRKPWEPRPYATWKLDHVDASGKASIAGAAYDPRTRRLYLTQAFSGTPAVHLYSVATPEAGRPDPPGVSRKPSRKPPGD